MPTVENTPNLPVVAAERGYNREQWGALQVIWPNAEVEVALVALDYCKARGLDPVKRPVHIVSTWDDKKRQYVQSIWEGIGSHRTTASRTQSYAGIDEAEFGPMIPSQKWGISYPEWCRVTVYRLLHGERCAFVAKLFFEEVAGTVKDGFLGRNWKLKPRLMLSKCTEAEALRKAFPEELGSIPVVEEVQAQDEMIDITPPKTAPAEEPEPSPRRKKSKLDNLEQNLAGPPPDADVPPASAPASGEAPPPAGNSPAPDDGPPHPPTEEDVFGFKPIGAIYPDGVMVDRVDKNIINGWVKAWDSEMKNISRDPSDVRKDFEPAYEAMLAALAGNDSARKYIKEFAHRTFEL